MSVGAKSAVLLGSLHGLHKPLQEILLQFPATISPQDDLAAVVSSFCRALRHLFGASGAYCWELSDSDELIGLAADGAKAASFPGLRLSLKEPSLAREAMETARGVFVNHVDAPGTREQSILAVPLLAFGRASGALVITQDSCLHPFDIHAASAMLVVGAHLGSLLANARLATELHEEKRRSEALINAAQGLNARQDLAAIKLEICRQAMQLVHGHSAVVAWSHPDGFSLDAVSSSAIDVQPERRLSGFASELAARAVRNSGVLEGVAPASDPLFEGDLLAVSITTEQGCGALLVSSGKQVFGPRDKGLLLAFSGIASTVLSSAELHGNSTTRADDLQKLIEISAGLRRQSSIDRFLEEFVVRTVEFLGFQRASVVLIENGEPLVRWIAADGKAQALREPLQSALLRQVLTSEEIFADNQAVTYPFGVAIELDRPSQRQVLAAPLRTAAGAPIGSLNLFDRVDGQPISESDIRRARALAAEAALVLESARNFERLEQHRHRAEDLVELALVLNSSLELPELAQAFTIRTAQLLNAPAAAVVLSSGEVRDTICLHPEPESGGEALAHRLSCALADVIRVHGGREVYGNVNALLGDNLGQALGWADVEIVPVSSGNDDLLGVLCLANRGRALDPSESHLLRAVVAHAASAIENCRLFGEIAQSNRNWGELFDAISDMLIVHDDHNRLVRMNRAVEEAVGVSSSQLAGVDVRALSPLCGEREGACPLCALPNEGNAEYENKAWQRVYLVSTSRSSGGSGCQTIHILKDVSDRREAERLYRELFDNIHEGLFFSTPEGRFIEVNDALVRMLGYESRDELLQVNIPEQLYISPDQRKQMLARVEENGAMRSLEGILRRKDGALIHTLKNVFAVRDADGKTRQYRGLVLDITELKKSQKELQRERDFNLKILNNTQTMIVVADTAGLISYANDRCLNACGGSSEGLVGRPLSEIFVEPWRQQIAASIQATAEGKQVEQFEAPLLYGGTRAIQHSISLSPMLDDQGNVTSIIALMTDITDAAMLQAKLIHSEKMAAVGQLVSGVAHEVNNPLTAIMGFADLLASAPELPASARKEVEIIFQEAQRTKQIVQNLLSFARQTTPHREEVDLNGILQRTLQLRQYDFNNHGVKTEEQYDPARPVVFGDPQQLQQVFLNIINNAYDAVSACPNPPRISVSTRLLDGMVEIVVADNGVGTTVPDRIFDPFFTTKTVGKGTGLGLSICYGIVHEHGGEITCRSEGENKGATFFIRLPIHDPAREGAR